MLGRQHGPINFGIFSGAQRFSDHKAYVHPQADTVRSAMERAHEARGIHSFDPVLNDQMSDDFRLRILANGKPVFRPQNYRIPLTLLAWMNLHQGQQSQGTNVATCTTPEILSWIDAFLAQPNALGPRADVQAHVNGILNDAVQYFNSVGGLATINDKSRPSKFTLWFRGLSGFLPIYRL